MYFSFVVVDYTTYKVFQKNVSSRENTRETCQFVCYKIAVAMKIILVNAKLLFLFQYPFFEICAIVYQSNPDPVLYLVRFIYSKMT